MKIKVIIEQTEDGSYVAFCPELTGCMSQGDTLDEVKENIKEAAQGWIEAKIQLDLQMLVKKNHDAKIPKNGHRIENITISSSKLGLVGA